MSCSFPLHLQERPGLHTPTFTPYFFFSILTAATTAAAPHAGGKLAKLSSNAVLAPPVTNPAPAIPSAAAAPLRTTPPFLYDWRPLFQLAFTKSCAPLLLSGGWSLPQDLTHLAMECNRVGDCICLL